VRSYTYRAEDEPEKKKPALVRPQLVGRRWVIRAGVGVLRVLAVLAVVASFVGTYFGARGEVVPTESALALWGALSDGGAWALALGLQALLTLGQWAARAQLVTIWQRGDPYARLAGWLVLYGACLGISLNFNFVAWYTPLTLALGSGFAAAVTIVASDILPEWLLVE
jgi:hypothetical protein